MCAFSHQYIVIPNRRSTAEALQVMFIHLLGDCGSPYIVGVVRRSSRSFLSMSQKFGMFLTPPPLPARQVSDAIYRSDLRTPAWNFYSLQYSIVICPVVGFIGGLFYLMSVLYINDDRKAVLRFLEGRVV